MRVRLVFLVTLVVLMGCGNSANHFPEEDQLKQKQVEFDIYYRGLGVVVNSIDAYRTKFGKWPQSYGELFSSGLLQSQYDYGSKDGRKTQQIRSDFAKLRVIKADAHCLRYQLTILDHEFSEKELKVP